MPITKNTYGIDTVKLLKTAKKEVQEFVLKNVKKNTQGVNQMVKKENYV